MARRHGLLTLAARQATAETDRERVAASLDAIGGTLAPTHQRAAAAAASVLLHALALGAALGVPGGSPWGRWAAAGVLLALDPWFWRWALALVPTRSGLRPERVLPFLQPAAFLAVTAAAGLPAGAVLLLAWGSFVAGLLLSDRPDLRGPTLFLAAVAAGPASWLAWASLASGTLVTASRENAWRAGDFTGERRAAAHVELLEDRLARMQANRWDAYYDPLTRVLNRRGFRAESTKMLNYARLEGRRLGVIMLDIDHFKSINDTYGHELGDRALRSFADAVSRSIRPKADVLARLGGEEFAVITDDVRDEAGLHAFAERLRQVVQATPWDQTPEGDPLYLTCTVGYAVYPDCGVSTVDELLALADRALYEGKEGGRNRSVPYRKPGGTA